MPKVLILSRDAEEYYQRIEAAHLPALEKLAAAKNIDEALALGNDFDIIFGEPKRMRGILAMLPNLRWAQSTWAGVELLLDPTLRRDYALTKASGIYGILMSEYVFGYMLFHERRMLERLQAQKEKRWDESITGSLRGKTIGLLGVGSVGAHLARTAKHFGMTVRGYTRASEACSEVDEYFHGEALFDFAAGLDYLIGVLPTTDSTRHIVDAALLERLPAQAVFINVGRGATVDDSALINALGNRKLALAVLDVFKQVPLPTDHPFWQTPNLLITFHTSGPSLPGDLSLVFIENYNRYINGQPLLHQVDFERGY
jgi:phosphoglycerate dehydrogenase-like enzyme